MNLFRLFHVSSCPFISLAVSLGMSFAFSGLDASANGRPYIGSTWQMEKKLPYENCKIMSSFDGRSPFFRGTVGMGVGVTRFYDNQNFYLACTSGLAKDFAFLIPLRFEEIFYFGAMAEVSNTGSIEFVVSNLENKTVADLFGTFRGVVGGITLGAGKKVGAMMNSKGIEIKYKSKNLGLFGVSFGYSSLEFKPENVRIESTQILALDGSAFLSFQELSDVSAYRFVKYDPSYDTSDLSSESDAGSTDTDDDSLISVHGSRE